MTKEEVERILNTIDLSDDSIDMTAEEGIAIKERNENDLFGFLYDAYKLGVAKGLKSIGQDYPKK